MITECSERKYVEILSVSFLLEDFQGRSLSFEPLTPTSKLKKQEKKS